jgi:hypothetical protein
MAPGGKAMARLEECEQHTDLFGRQLAGVRGHVGGAAVDAREHPVARHPVARVGQVGLADAALPRHLVAVQAALVENDPGPVGNRAGRRADHHRRDRGRVHARRPGRQVPHVRVVADHADDEGDHEQGPRPARRAPLAPARDKRQDDEEDAEHERPGDDHPAFGPVRDEREQGEVPEEVPVGARGGVH